MAHCGNTAAVTRIVNLGLWQVVAGGKKCEHVGFHFHGISAEVLQLRRHMDAPLINIVKSCAYHSKVHGETGKIISTIPM